MCCIYCCGSCAALRTPISISWGNHPPEGPDCRLAIEQSHTSLEPRGPVKKKKKNTYQQETYFKSKEHYGRDGSNTHTEATIRSCRPSVLSLINAPRDCIFSIHKCRGCEVSTVTQHREMYLIMEAFWVGGIC